VEIINKFKQLPQARLSQFVVLALLVYIASILADITWRVMPSGPATAGNALVAPKLTGGGASSSGQNVDVRSIISQNIFGQHNAQVDVIDEPEIIQDDIPETSLNLTLAATVAEGVNSGKGTAIIESSGKQGTYGIGDKIDSTSATVKLVYSDRVIIQNGSRKETLMLDGVEYDNRNVARPTQEPEDDKRNNSSDRFKRDKDGQLMMPGSQKHITQPSKSRRNSKKVDNRKNDKLRSELSKKRDDFAKDPKKLFDLIRFNPVRKGGELTGYRLNPGAEPELFRQAGFRANDLAVEVNGYSLTDMQEAMTALREFRTMTEANIVVERDGVQTEILFSLDAANNGQDDRRPKPAPDKRPNKLKLNR
jgi:general secretion pathway protein C